MVTLGSLEDKQSMKMRRELLLNDDMNCKGVYTWNRNNQKSVIDYAICNKKFDDIYTYMKIDEKPRSNWHLNHNLEVKLKII